MGAGCACRSRLSLQFEYLPIQHDHYGMPDAPRFAYYPRSKSGLLELPITTMRLSVGTFPLGAEVISGSGLIRSPDGFYKG